MKNEEINFNLEGARGTTTKKLRLGMDDWRSFNCHLIEFMLQIQRGIAYKTF